MELRAMAAEADPHNPDLLDDIFRVAHTIKGNAAALGFPELAAFAHKIEDLLEKLRNKQLAVSGDVVSLLLSATDTFRALLLGASRGSDGLNSDQEELKEQIVSKAAAVMTTGHADAVDDCPSPLPVAGSAIQESRHRFLRVDVRKLDTMLNLTGEIAILQGRLRQIAEEIGDDSRDQVIELHRECERLHKELQEQVMSARMVPVGPLFQHLARTVRDLARSQKKQVRLEAIGCDVEVDTRVLEQLKDPLLHMIRNAIDHGIESPETRIASKKDRCGLLRLRASHVSGNILIELSDDGSGFSKKRILEKAMAAGIVTDGAKLSDQEIFQFAFQAGFSTAEKVTDISGRGVGMDVVKRNIESLRGSIDIQSFEGSGCTFILRLPLTLAIIEGFSVVSGNETYVLPLETISECLDLPADYMASDNGGVISVRGEALPFVRLSKILGTGESRSKRESLIVLQFDSVRAGLAVDELLGESQAIIKPLDRLFHKVPAISGSTILGDGRVALILDVTTLMREAVRNQIAVN
jgi:two-component system chemotaxis sensor kinase CheA